LPAKAASIREKCRLEPNSPYDIRNLSMTKIFAIGDIHGCFNKLVLLMDTVDIDFNQDTLVFMGDYIDRGPDSFEVVEYLMRLKKKYSNIVLLKGNHEEMLLNYLSGSDRYLYLANGGQQTIESYMDRPYNIKMGPIPSDHLDFFKSLDLFCETEEYIFVHAGLKKKVPLKEQMADDLLWIRKNFIKTNYDFGKRVVFGHTPFPKPLVESNKIGIDTGAVFGNKLTCVELPTLTFYDV
jgi:serine/threonine protein phosphatase 1